MSQPTSQYIPLLELHLRPAPSSASTSTAQATRSPAVYLVACRCSAAPPGQHAGATWCMPVACRFRGFSIVGADLGTARQIHRRLAAQHPARQVRPARGRRREITDRHSKMTSRARTAQLTAARARRGLRCPTLGEGDREGQGGRSGRAGNRCGCCSFQDDHWFATPDSPAFQPALAHGSGVGLGAGAPPRPAGPGSVRGPVARCDGGGIGPGRNIVMLVAPHGPANGLSV
ncbi:hypothetical protein WOLCODRAFT_156712 [Wolfiporia cocos MD-104 SS10]|uniref:Uncharacterized protein n=1 Tax=Wolfiporia cocos (strain MD-104) TaxID=742152 RepID=A0A2H3J158_WOLCO|nr:hypothetical protein WOLCODRAFT_156712 [Wolfiporia cocos MD-104 SS10]